MALRRFSRWSGRLKFVAAPGLEKASSSTRPSKERGEAFLLTLSQVARRMLVRASMISGHARRIIST